MLSHTGCVKKDIKLIFTLNLSMGFSYQKNKENLTINDFTFTRSRKNELNKLWEKGGKHHENDQFEDDFIFINSNNSFYQFFKF